MSAPPNHGTDQSADQQRKGITPSGDIVISDVLVDAILEVGPVFCSDSDGKPVCIVAQRMTTNSERQRT